VTAAVSFASTIPAPPSSSVDSREYNQLRKENAEAWFAAGKAEAAFQLAARERAELAAEVARLCELILDEISVLEDVAEHDLPIAARDALDGSIERLSEGRFGGGT